MTVLVPNACFRAATCTSLLKMRQLNILPLLIPPCTKVADHCHGFSGRSRTIEKKYDSVTMNASHRWLNLLFMSSSHLLCINVL